MEIKAEKIKPYASDTRHKGDQVREMFDNIAPAYDFMNRAMTLGIDKQWRKKAVARMVEHKADKSKTLADDRKQYRVLDVATGTGDLAIQMAKALGDAHITGIDLSAEMMRIGAEKAKKEGLDEIIDFQQADCLHLPFPDNSFDCVSVAFGVRNFEFLVDGYSEMHRVLKPGGLLCVLELTVPSSALIRPFYRLYTRHVIPIAGRIASKDMSAYTYLPASIEAVPQRLEMTALIDSVGFIGSAYRDLTLGVCNLYTAYKKSK